MDEYFDMHHFKRTKMVCTIGPATESYDNLEKLVHIGMNVARLNFSHGSYEQFSQIIANIREISEKHQKPVAIIADLQGPKIRVGNLSQDLTLQQESLAYLGAPPDEQYPAIPIQYNFIPYLKPQHIIFFNDGYIKAKVEEIYPDYALIKIMNEGVLSSNKGINIPDTMIDDGKITEKDYQDLQFAIEKDVDYLAISFVQKKEDIQQFKDIIHASGKNIKVITKVETKGAIDNIHDVIKTSDVIMIARGDLAVEIGIENVPMIQMQITDLCKKAKTPVIVATQMLESMILNPRPTRAEVSDVANAAFSEVDAVMLSAESAVGQYPFHAAEVMRSIIKATENKIIESPDIRIIKPEEQYTSNADAIGAAATLIANQMHSDLVCVATKTGSSVLSVSSLRPNKTIIAITQSMKVYNQLALVWGVRVFWINDEVNSIDDLVDQTIEILKKSQFIKEYAKVIFVTGLHVGVEGETNSLRILDVKE